MEILHLILRFWHFVGLSFLLGGFLTQFGSKIRKINTFILSGATIQFVTGIILTGLNEPNVNHIKISLKLGLSIIILLMAFFLRRKDLSTTVFFIFLAFIISTLGIAVFWK